MNPLDKTPINDSVIASQLRLSITLRPDNTKLNQLWGAYNTVFDYVESFMEHNGISTVPCCRNKLHDIVDRCKTITAALERDYCTHKKIDEMISIMKKEKEFLREPNYSGIQKVFLENGLHVEWERKIYNRDWWRGTKEEQEKITQDEKDYLLKMLREIIACDYEKKVFERKDRNERIIQMGREGEELNDVWPQSMWHICWLY